MYSTDKDKFRLYNAGDRIEERFPYTIDDQHDTHCIAYWYMRAPEKEFFEVPKVLLVRSMRISVAFIETILREDRYGARGVVLIDANWNPEDSSNEGEDPVAVSEEEAVKKGNRIWNGYIDRTVQQFLDQCNAIRAAGGVPLAAGGFVKRALMLRNVEDPSKAVLIQTKANTSEIDELKERMAKQDKLIENLLAERGDKPAKGPKREPAAASRPGRAA